MISRYSTYQRNKVGSWLGAYSYTPPATIYVGLHFAGLFSSAASAGASSVSCSTGTDIGTVIILEPSVAAKKETFLVTNVLGSGPYTISLGSYNGGPSVLQYSHLISTFIHTDPGFALQFINEPSPANAYARVSKTNNSTNWSSRADGLASNLTVATFPTPSGLWGLAVGGFLSDASSGLTNILQYGDLVFPVYIDGTSAAPSFPIGTILDRISEE